jgi:pyridoxal phosphate enzyme (YggS family)
MSTLEERLCAIGERIRAAARRSGRDARSVRLVAVSKTHPTAAIRKAYAAGQRLFGENYAQELRDKAVELSDLPDIEWHFIGHLQRNKVKYVAPSAGLVETIDSFRLAQELEAQARKAGRVLDCLVQVNVGKEKTKSGCEPEQADKLMGEIESLPNLRLIGLMTIPPFDLEAEQTRVYFQSLRALRDSLGGPSRLPHLSMGMSHDFEAAIEEGATLVRVGTAIFGPRDYS